MYLQKKFQLLLWYWVTILKIIGAQLKGSNGDLYFANAI
jgi:hypothetical protein